MQDLTALVEAAPPALAACALEPAPAGRFDAALGSNRRFVLEAVYEGYLMHYGESRAFAVEDRDLCLLGGDALYALGLSRLAEAGDIEAVAALAALITASARAHAEERGAEVDALWRAAATALSEPPR